MDKIARRQEYNLMLLEVLKNAIEKFPEWRFHQILQNLGYTLREGGDMFYEESFETLKRVETNPIAHAEIERIKHSL